MKEKLETTHKNNTKDRERERERKLKKDCEKPM